MVKTFKILGKKTIIMVVLIMLGFSFLCQPIAQAKSKLTLGSSDFYYSGTQKGSYVATVGIKKLAFDLLSAIANILVLLATEGPIMVVVGWLNLLDNLFSYVMSMTTVRIQTE